jgi:hypothetical protein
MAIRKSKLWFDVFPAWVQPGRALRVNQLAIASDLENAAARSLELDPGVGEFLLDPGLQLEGSGAVPSGIAVFDIYIQV